MSDWRGLTECPCCGEKVKNCPFCGAPGQVYGSNNVGCTDIECSGQVDFGHWMGERDGIPAVHWVIKAWNRRVYERKDKSVKKLEKILSE